MPKSKEIDVHSDISKPENIIWLYKNDYLVNVQNNSYRQFRTEVNKHYGWRIVDDYTCIEASRGNT